MKTVVTVGSVKLPIYHTPHGDRERFTLAWHEAGQRKRKVFDDLDKAKGQAREIGAKLTNGKVDLLALNAADAESYIIAKRELQPLGIPLHDAVRQYIAAIRALPAGASLLEAVTEYGKRANGEGGKTAVGDLVESYITQCEQSKKKGTLGIRHLQTLRSHLRRFAGAFKTSIGAVNANAIDEWLRDVASAPRSFNNFKASLTAFFSFARDKGHLAADVPTAAEKVKRRKLKDHDIGILTPGQLATLLANGNDEARLYLAVGGFAGIRVAEMVRLTWERFDWEMGLIRLDKSITKTGAKRNVPILPALAAWLEPYRGRKGKVFSSEKVTDRVIAYVKEQGTEWPANALRHSFCSYRTAATKSQPQVALEAGNSVAMIRRHYDSVVSERDALAWFAIAPQAPANVTPMTRAA